MVLHPLSANGANDPTIDGARQTLNLRAILVGRHPNGLWVMCDRAMRAYTILALPPTVEDIADFERTLGKFDQWDAGGRQTPSAAAGAPILSAHLLDI